MHHTSLLLLVRCAQGAPDAATIMAKTAAAFLKFLDEAALFYKRLVMQLQVCMHAAAGEGHRCAGSCSICQ
jgi:hypothetical protein